MPDEKDPAGQDERPAESRAPEEPVADADATAATAPPIIVSATGIPMIPGLGVVDGPAGAWAGLPPPRNPAAGPWTTATGPADVLSSDDEDRHAARRRAKARGNADDDPADDDRDDDPDAQNVDARDLDARDLDAHGLDAHGLDEPEFDEPDPADFDDEDEDDDEDKRDGDGVKPSWQKNLSADAPRRRRLSPEVKVAAFGLLAAALLVTGAVLISKAVGGSSSTSAADALGTLAPDSTAPAAPAASTKVGSCVYTADGQQPARGMKLPPAGPSVDTRPATMTIRTNYGTMIATLDATKAPCTVHALEYLAQQQYFNQTTCHRETAGEGASIFVLQCGDPTGQGAGTPGFAYKNENTGGVTYNRGVLAMANAGPDTNGSQFFINYANPTAGGAQNLAGGYTVFGQITQGLDVLDKITAPGVQAGGDDGAPASKPQISSITITQ
jgi:cyclophilin family peptidyl-prolyl cis-trans isomerase